MKCPNNCGADGPHFAPPCFGQPGFFTCRNDPSIGPPVNPITTDDPPPHGDTCICTECAPPEPMDTMETGTPFKTAAPVVAPEVNAQVAALVERMKTKGDVKNPAVLNAKLQAFDEIVQSMEAVPSLQMGILIMAVVLATRRLLAQSNIKDRGRRSKLLKITVAEFERKLRRYVAAHD